MWLPGRRRKTVGVVTPPFDPTSIPGLQLLIRDALGMYQDTGGSTPATVAGDPVNLAKDQTSNHRDLSRSSSGFLLAAGIGSVLALRSKPVVTPAFTGGLGLASGAFAQSQPFTVAFVHRVWRCVNSACDVASDGLSAGTTAIAQDDLPQSYIYAGAVGCSDAHSHRSWGITLATVNGASSSVRRNGTVIGASTPGTGNLDGFTLAALGSNAGRGIDSVFHLVAVYSGLSGANISVLEAGLSSLYGIPLTPTTEQVICSGDSLTYGSLCADPNAESWPGQMQVDSRFQFAWDIHNLGVPGQLVQDVGGVYNAAVLFSDNSLFIKQVVVIELGINDLLQGGTAAATYGHLLTLIGLLQAAAFVVVVCTLTDAQNYSGAPADINTQRANYNASIISGAVAHSYTVADVAGVAAIGANGAGANSTYFQTDQLHLKPAGYALVYPVVATAVLAV